MALLAALTPVRTAADWPEDVKSAGFGAARAGAGEINQYVAAGIGRAIIDIDYFKPAKRPQGCL